MIWWIFTFIFIPISFVIIYILIKHYSHEYDEKIRCRYEFLPNDFKWDAKTALIFNFIGFFVGILSAMLGIGGGILMGPLLLAFKVEPIV